MKKAQIQAQAWLYCGLADTEVASVPASAVAAAMATAATVAMTATVTMTAGAMTTVAAVAVAAAVAAAVITAVSAAILHRCRRSNPLTMAPAADGATGAADAFATTASFQRRRPQRHSDLPAPAHVWLCSDRAVAAGAKCSYSHFLSLLSLISLIYIAVSLILEQNPYFVHFPHDISLKLVLLADKS